MRVEMNFNGSRLDLRLVVEDDTERAIAELMERLTAATVHVEADRDRYGYQYERDRKITAISISMQEPPPKITGAPCSDCENAMRCESENLCAYAPPR